VETFKEMANARLLWVFFGLPFGVMASSLRSALNVKREGAVSSQERKAKQKARAMRGPFVLCSSYKNVTLRKFINNDRLGI
jgi:hypothetical protein